MVTRTSGGTRGNPARHVEQLEPRTVMSDASAFGGDVVLAWNEVALDALRAAP